MLAKKIELSGVNTGYETCLGASLDRDLLSCWYTDWPPVKLDVSFLWWFAVPDPGDILPSMLRGPHPWFSGVIIRDFSCKHQLQQS